MPKGTKHSYFNEKGCAHKSTSFFYALSPGKENPPATAGVNRGKRDRLLKLLSPNEPCCISHITRH